MPKEKDGIPAISYKKGDCKISPAREKTKPVLQAASGRTPTHVCLRPWKNEIKRQRNMNYKETDRYTL